MQSIANTKSNNTKVSPIKIKFKKKNNDCNQTTKNNIDGQIAFTITATTWSAVSNVIGSCERSHALTAAIATRGMAASLT